MSDWQEAKKQDVDDAIRGAALMQETPEEKHRAAQEEALRQKQSSLFRQRILDVIQEDKSLRGANMDELFEAVAEESDRMLAENDQVRKRIHEARDEVLFQLEKRIQERDNG
jgi:hypothetical protein